MVLVIVLILSGFALFFGLVMIFFENPLYSIISFVLCILFSVLLLIAYGVEFMSFIYLAVYIGAIAILFLFVTMMLNVNSINILPTYSVKKSVFIYACIFFKTFSLVFLVNKNIFLQYLYPSHNHIPIPILTRELEVILNWCGDMLQSVTEYMAYNDKRWMSNFRIRPVHVEKYLFDIDYQIILSLYEGPSYTPYINFSNASIDSLADNVISSFDSRMELANFCLLYDIYVINFFLAGFILLCAMLGSISLCLQK
jgi:NADH:ubiquinone oxidoreductase subunit 6 (subunit J)